MVNNIHFPQQLSAEALDTYLENGWYRLGQIIFTTDYIPHADRWYRVFWLRYAIARIDYGKKPLKLLAANQHFDIAFKPLQITTELEELFQRYRSHILFEGPASVISYLFDGNTAVKPLRNVFDTMMIEIRNEGRLVAAGIFDNGAASIAGIMNFYDPAYHQYSLGKWLMLLKINLAKQTGRNWYYPGYIAHEYTKFDYKLFPGENAAEIFDPLSREWLPYSPALVASLTMASPMPEKINEAGPPSSNNTLPG